MKIAFISFEYPPDTAWGGIATYVWHAARMLAARGHGVEIFAGSAEREGTTGEDNVTVHRIRANGPLEFSARIAPIAAARHRSVGFDVFESPELNAEAAPLLEAVRDAALVVKLHTPSHLIGRFTESPLTAWRKLRFALGALRRAKRPQWPDAEADAAHHARERNFTLLADEVAAPSAAIRDVLATEWNLRRDRISLFPLPYAPAAELLQLEPAGGGQRVLFVGRLEPRKGVHYLAAAIPPILAACPAATFRFVGRVMHSPRRGLAMDEFIRTRVGMARASALEFTGAVPASQLPAHFGSARVAVFPSAWESFGYVCLEAMAAGRAIVASRNGGMREILADGATGRVVTPSNSRELAAAVIALLKDPAECGRLGALARERVLSVYNYATIAPAQEASYQRAIERRRALGPRDTGELRVLAAATSPRAAGAALSS